MIILKTTLQLTRPVAPKEQKGESLFQLLLPGLIGMIVCAVSLAGLSFAWFTSAATAPAQTFSAANFHVTAEVSGPADGATVTVDARTGKIALAMTQEGRYEVALTASGTGTGYAVIAFRGEEKVTGDLKDGDVFRFEVVVEGAPEEAVSCSVTPMWRPYGGPTERTQSGLVFTYAKAPAESVPPVTAGSGEPAGESGSDAGAPAKEESVPVSTKPAETPENQGAEEASDPGKAEGAPENLPSESTTSEDPADGEAN